MENTFFGILYRNGLDTAVNTVYMWHLDAILGCREKDVLRLEFVKRYDKLPIEKADKISRIVEGYRGPQRALIERIDEILNE